MDDTQVVPRDPTTANDNGGDESSASGATATPTAQAGSATAAPGVGTAAPVPTSSATDVLGGATAKDASGEPTAKPTPTTTTVEPAHHGMLHGILDALGGTQDVEYSRDKETGKMIATRTRIGTGQQWKRIIAGALTGAARGAAVKPGPGQLGRAAAAGFEGGQDMVTNIDDRKRANADADFKAQQEAMVNKAQSAHIQQMTAESTWRIAREKGEFDAQTSMAAMQLHNLIGSDPSSKSLGMYPSFADFLNDHHGNGQILSQGMMSGEIKGVPVFNSDGSLKGLQIYQVAKGWNTQRNDKPVQVIMGAKLGPKGEVTPDIQTIPAGAEENGHITELGQLGLSKYMEASHKKAETDKANREQTGEVTPKDRFEQSGKERIENIKQAGENTRAAGKGEDKPVYAFDPTSNKTVLTTKGKAKEGNFQAVRDVKETDIKADMHDTRVLNDVSLKSRNVALAARAMDEKSWGQATLVANYLAAHPNENTASLVLKNINMKHMTPAAKDYTIKVLNLRESAMGLQKVLTGSARTNETQLNALQAVLPGLEPDSKTVNEKLKQFTQNITMLRQGIPEMPGINVISPDPDTQTFSKSAWKQANPNGDVNKAVETAKQHGFEIAD